VQRTIYSKEYQHFLALMIEARTEAGITQIELAKKLKKPQSFVCKYEIGERRLDIIEFLTVCKALKIDAKKILAKLLKRYP